MVFSDLKSGLSHLSAELISLHKELLDYQTHRAEDQDARKYNPYELLNMSLNDPRFDWIRKLSKLITRIDIHASENERTSMLEVSALVDEVNALLAGAHPDFSTGYNSALRANLRLAGSEAKVKQSLAGLESFLRKRPL